MLRRGFALSLAALAVLALTARTATASPSTHASGVTIALPPGLPNWPPLPALHALQSGHTAPPANVAFAEDELVDSKKAAARLDGGGCSHEQCQSHCRQKLHAAGRCDQDLCACRDLKARGRCQVMGFGCGSDDDGAAGRSIVNNNNNNNVLVVH